MQINKTHKALISKILIRAKQILTENKWIKGVYAEDKDGNEVSARSEHACGFCIGGSIIKAHHEIAPQHEITNHEVMAFVEEYIINTTANPAISVADHNDHVISTKEEAIDTLTKAHTYFNEQYAETPKRN